MTHFKTILKNSFGLVWQEEIGECIVSNFLNVRRRWYTTTFFSSLVISLHALISFNSCNFKFEDDLLSKAEHGLILCSNSELRGKEEKCFSCTIASLFLRKSNIESIQYSCLMWMLMQGL